MRRQRVYRFVVVLVLIFPGKIFSQQVSPRIAQISPHEAGACSSCLLNPATVFFNKIIDQDKFLRPKTQRIFQLAGTTENVPSLTVQHFAYCTSYLSHLGFFCQKEYQFQKSTSVPLRLRLGSLAYVDRMEGKK